MTKMGQPDDIIHDAEKAIRIYNSTPIGIDVREATSAQLDVHDPEFLISMIKILVKELKKAVAV